MFYLYRPAIFDGDEDDNDRITGGREWDRERWWYKLARVCQRWRTLILGSASYLSLYLVCTLGTPVAEMLAHSPPLPLIVDFNAERDITTEDEEGIILALGHRDRVSRLRLQIPFPNLQRLIMAMDEEYPALEYLILGSWMDVEGATLILSGTLQAPHLRHLALRGFALSLGSRLLTTAVGLVTLALVVSHPSIYLQPDFLLQWLSFMPQLETLLITFSFPVPNRDVERQLMQMPAMTHVTLPNLRWFVFQGVNAYLEAVVHRITTPRLEKLDIHFFFQLTFSVPCLLQFMSTAENLSFDSAEFNFGFSGEQVTVGAFPREEAKTHALSISVLCWHLDWQVSSVAQISNALGQIYSAVEHLTLAHWIHGRSSEEHNEVDRAEWGLLLRPFTSVKSLHVDEGVIKELSRGLRLNDGELPLDLLPKLQELTYSDGDTGDDFNS